VTGGWPVLVDEAEAGARVANARRAVAEIEAGLAARAAWLLEVVGVAEGPLADAFDAVAELLGPDGRELPGMLGEVIGAPGDTYIRALIAAGVLVDDGDMVSVEPVVAAAWVHAHSGVV